MPIPKPKADEQEKDYISRCISAIAPEYTEEGQPYAICKGEFDKMSEQKLAVEDTSQLPEPKPNEGRDQYLRRCVPTIYKAGGEYDQRTATAMCADRYENSNTLLSKKLDSFSSVARKIRLYFAEEEMNIELEAKKILSEKFADGEGGGSYPWDECIADQVARYGDQATAERICGFIKSEYGS